MELRKIEDAITSDIKIPATCLGAKEIAQFIAETGLIPEFLDAIGAPLASGAGRRLETAEMVLHAYSTFSGDKFEHQNEVYEDSLLLTLKLHGPLSRDELIAKTIELLSCAPTRAGILTKRIDRLLATRQIRSAADKQFDLSVETAADLEAADRLYLREMNTLQAAQAALMADKYGVVWTNDDAEKTSVFLSRAFVKAQLETLQSAGTNLTATGLFRNLGDPVQDLRDYLRRQGVRADGVKAASEELLEQAKDLPVIKKLTHAAVH